MVEYTYLPLLNFWNLGFGDFDESSGEISDTITTDNGDARKVVATVAVTLLDFFAAYPEETVIFSGSDSVRTRAYQRAIVQYATSFASVLKFSGLTEEGEEIPIETDRPYFAFLVKRKQPAV